MKKKMNAKKKISSKRVAPQKTCVKKQPKKIAVRSAKVNTAKQSAKSEIAMTRKASESNTSAPLAGTEFPFPLQIDPITSEQAAEIRKQIGLEPDIIHVNKNFNNVLTASRMGTAMQCWRKHFWQNEIGLAKITETSMALRIGSAWARAMESRWHGSSYEEALAVAIPVGSTMFSEYDAATISGLLAAYYDVYGETEQCGKIHPEVQFSSDLGDGWTAQGKIDGLGSLMDGRSVIVESKTTSDQLDPDSDYWLRLNFNIQVQQYIVEARKLGWDIVTAFYDVTKKPMISPRQNIEDLDAEGLKIVIGEDGERVINQKGKFAGLPKQSADKDKGQYVKSHRESAEEFCDRVYKDAMARPEFYFCRKEIPVIEGNLDSFIRQRLLIRDTIEFYRSMEDHQAGKPMQIAPRDPEAWPRNVSSDTCDFCPFKSFCLQDLSIDLEHPPEGFQIKCFNPELQTEKK
jgi:hypothetical protein